MVLSQELAPYPSDEVDQLFASHEQFLLFDQTYSKGKVIAAYFAACDSMSSRPVRLGPTNL